MKEKGDIGVVGPQRVTSMTGKGDILRHLTNPDVSAVEHQIIAESLRRVARIRPDVAMVMAEILLAADERELGYLAHALTSEEAMFALSLVGELIRENGGQA